MGKGSGGKKLKKRAKKEKSLTKKELSDYYITKLRWRCRTRVCGLQQDEGVQKGKGCLFFFGPSFIELFFDRSTTCGEGVDKGVRKKNPGRFFFFYDREGSAGKIFLKEEDENDLQQTEFQPGDPEQEPGRSGAAIGHLCDLSRRLSGTV